MGSLRWAVAAWWLLGGLTIGCSQRSEKTFVPNNQVAQTALTIALDAWKSGGPAPESLQIPEGPRIHVLDTDWRAGHKLTAFEILQEVPQEPSAPRQFSVRITCTGQQPKEAVYYIVGVDPLWVFRDIDYKKTSGM